MRTLRQWAAFVVLLVAAGYAVAQVNPFGWSTTAGSNSTVGGVSIAEGMSPSGVNNGMRAIMAGVKEALDVLAGAKTTAGSSNAYTLTSGMSLSAYAAGQAFMIEANHTNSGASTLDVDGIGAKNITRSDDSDVVSGDIVSGGHYLLVYEAGQDEFNLINPSALGAISTEKHSIYIPAGALIAASTNGPASGTTEETTNAHNYATYAFDASTDEYAAFELLMPKNWDESTITFQVSWTTAATDSDGVAWGLQCVAVADGDDSDVAYGTAVVVTDDAQSNAGDVLITAESSAVTVNGSPAAGELTQCRVFRDVSDANDDMTEDALLRGLRVFYTIDAADET